MINKIKINFKLYLFIFNKSLDLNTKIYLLSFLVFSIYLISSLNWYDQSWQYDWEKHKIYFYTFFEKNHISPYIEAAPWWYNVYGPWVYLIYFIFFLPFFYLADSLSGSVIYFQDLEHAIEYTIRLGNILLYGVYLYGLIKFSKKIGLSLIGQRYFVLLSFLNPITFQYSLYAIPENLIFSLFPYLLIFFLNISLMINDGNLKNIINFKSLIFLIFTITAATQKGNGLLLIIFLMIFLCLNLKYNLINLKILLISLIILYLSINSIAYIAKLFNGYWWWQHPIVTHWANNPPPDKGFFTNFDLIQIWSDPFRGSQKNSMLGIWYVDLYGDYWNYWFNNKNLVENHNLNQNFITKYGLLLSTITLILLLYSSYLNIINYFNSKIDFYKLYFSFLWILVFIISILMVKTGFDIRKGSSVNLMYSYFLIPSVFLSIILSFQLQKNLVIKRIKLYAFIFILMGNFIISLSTPIRIYL